MEKNKITQAVNMLCCLHELLSRLMRLLTLNEKSGNLPQKNVLRRRRSKLRGEMGNKV